MRELTQAERKNNNKEMKKKMPATQTLKEVQLRGGPARGGKKGTWGCGHTCKTGLDVIGVSTTK